jgi:hypothetical protein
MYSTLLIIAVHRYYVPVQYSPTHLLNGSIEFSAKYELDLYV